MRETELDPGAVEAAYRRAGELTNLLHGSQTGKWFGRPDINGNPIELTPYVDPVQYVSWDSTPGNWLVDERGVLTGMIDFENMLWGIDVDSFSILFSRYFSGNPAAGKAFFQGYGPEVLRNRSAEIQICCIKMAIGDICWGNQHDAPEVVRYGRELLKNIYHRQLILEWT